MNRELQRCLLPLSDLCPKCSEGRDGIDVDKFVNPHTAVLVASSAHLLMCGWNSSSSLMESIMVWIAEIFSFNLPFNSAKDKWA